MLIRSQNREVLINFNTMAGIEIAEGPIKTIITSYITGCSYLLGEYSTKEKAMKALDTIQEVYSDLEASKIISTGLAATAWAGDYDTPESAAGVTEILKECTEVINGAMVFQMPQDSEVKP